MNKIIDFHTAYLIRFRKIENERFLYNYVFPNFVQILGESGKDFDKRIAIEEDTNGEDIMVLFESDYKIAELIRFFEEENIDANHYNISNNLIQNKTKEEVVKRMMKSEEFKTIFDTFLMNNLTVDNVLDKINQYGIKSLTTIEKGVLANG